MDNSIQKLEELTLEIQVGKCRLSCQHCYAGDFSVRKNQMPFEDVLLCLDYFTGVCILPPTVYLYKDLVEYHAIESFFHALDKYGIKESVELLPTHGWIQGSQTELPSFTRLLARNGVKRVWLTLHGKKHEHDLFVRRAGAFDRIREFAVSCRETGIEVEWNLVLRNGNLGEIKKLADDPALRTISTEIFFSVPGYLGYAKKIENQRPNIVDVYALASYGLKPSTPIFSESMWIERISRLDRLATKPAKQPFAEVRIMPDLTIELHDFPYSKKIGNIRQTDPVEALKCILDETSLVKDVRNIKPSQAVRYLCTNYGDPNSDAAHCVYSIVNLWAHRALGKEQLFLRTSLMPSYQEIVTLTNAKGRIS